MGYVAYAAGTLIVAVVIHSFYSGKRKIWTTSGIRKGEAKFEWSVPTVSEPTDEVAEGDFSKSVTSPVTINISQDETDDSPASSERDESPPQRSRRQLSAAEFAPQSKAEEMQSDSLPPTPPSSAALSRVQSREMAPPPRPSSAPSLESAKTQARQRALMPPPSSLPPSRNRSPPRLKPATASSLTPPSRGALPTAQRQGGFAKPTGFSNTLSRPQPSQSTSLSVPKQKVLTNTRMQPSKLLPPTSSTQAPSNRPSRQITLTPGHSPLDWAALTRSTSPSTPLTLRGADASALLGPHRLGRITPSQLRRQTGRKGKDAWTSYQGRVYNISAYLEFHPGGVPELMKGAGRSSDGLFAEVHPWVNFEGMLSGCLVGILVAEDDPAAAGKVNGHADGDGDGGEGGNTLDEMD